jgi:zinc protease
MALSLVIVPGAAAFVDHGEIATRTLPNGLEVLVREDPAQSVVEVQIWVGVGSRDEPEGQEGIAHLFEHMLFKGTEKRGVGEIAAAIESAGGDINAYTSMDQTVYHITIAADYFLTAMGVLSDAIQNSSFDKGELEREKLVVIEEINRMKDNPGRVFSQELFRSAFTVHPYGRLVIGTEESVSGVSRKDMVSFFRQWYRPGNMKLVVVGGVRAEEVFEAANSLFTFPDVQGAVRKEAVEPAQTSFRTFRVHRDTDPARIALAFPISSLADPETPVYDLLAAILSQGNSSRLPINLRDKGIVLSAWTYAHTPRDPGIFVFGATVEQNRVREGLEGILEQIALLQNEPVSTEEIDRARNQILNDRIFDRERVEGQAREIGYLALNLGDTTFSDVYLSRIQAVDAADLMSAARRTFSPERATVGFLTREEDASPSDEVVEELLTTSLYSGMSEGDPAQRPIVFKSQFPNGITLLVREDHRLPLVAIRMGVLGGVRYENVDNQGAFNLLAHLLTRGTQEMSAAEMALALDSMSASLGGFSGRNSFGVVGKFLSRDIDEGFSLMRQVLTDAVLPANELDLYKERIISAIKARKDDMTTFALETFRATLFQEHPYRLSTLGTEESVRSMTRDELLEIYRNVVRPEGIVISVAGDVQIADIYRLVEKNFGDLSGSRYDPGPLPIEMSRSGVHSQRVVRGDKNQTHVILGYLGPTVNSPDRDSLEVLNAILAGQGGRLFTELRDRRSLAYSVFSFVAPGVDPGYVAFGIGVSPEREKEAVEGFLEQIRLIRDEPVSVEELERAKRYLIGSHMIGLQDLSSRGDEVFFPVLYGQDLESALRFARRIQSVTAHQIQEAARNYLDPENYTLAVVAGARADAETE